MLAANGGLRIHGIPAPASSIIRHHDGVGYHAFQLPVSGGPGFSTARRSAEGAFIPCSVPTATPLFMAAPEDTVVERQVIDPEKVAGDASLELKREVVRLWPFSYAHPDHFASSIGVRLELVEISVVPKREDAQAMEARMVAEIDVVPGVFSGYQMSYRAARLTNVYTRNAQPVRFHARWMYRIPDRPVRLDVPDVVEGSDPAIEDVRAHPTSHLRFITARNRAR